MAGRLERGEVRLYPFGAPDKQRPVVILTQTVALQHLSRATVAPITSTIRGVPSEIQLGIEDGMKNPCVVNLHNVLTVAKQDLGRRIAILSDARMEEVCGALQFALGCGVSRVTQ